MRSDDLTSHLGEFPGDMRTFAKHHAIDRHVLRHFLIFLVVFSFSSSCLETHVGMRACMQCTCKHDLICLSLNLNGGC